MTIFVELLTILSISMLQKKKNNFQHNLLPGMNTLIAKITTEPHRLFPKSDANGIRIVKERGRKSIAIPTERIEKKKKVKVSRSPNAINYKKPSQKGYTGTSRRE
jgi:hypothetical protein